jgi:predicted outer membrane repeat protein
MNRLLLSVFFLLCFSAGLFASKIEVSGTVSGTWSVDTVLVTGEILIPSGETLVIEPGVLVEFQGHYLVFVRGRVVALGTMEAPILFTAGDTTGFSDTTSIAGGWHGFVYQRPPVPNDTSVFVHCTFSYGKAVASDTTGVYGGAFRIFGWNKIRFSQCTFQDNLAYKWGGAIYAKESDIRIENCVFTRNRCGKATEPYGYGGALCAVKSDPLVVGNIFRYNQSTGIGGGASFEYSDPDLRMNTFDQNVSGLGGGLGYLRTAPARVASGNLISNNMAVFFGGGIACIRAHTVFVNNTVVNNAASYGGGFYCNDSAVPSSYNCVFHGNDAAEGVEVYIWDVRSAPNFFYCNVPGDTSAFAGSGGHEGYHGEYQHNLDEVPDFSGSMEAPYSLKRTSPFVDAGMPDTSGLQVPLKDLAGGERIYNGRIDIGAYEWNPGPGIEKVILHNHTIVVFPNPAHGNTSILIRSGLTESIDIHVYHSSGFKVKTFRSITVRPGENFIPWNCCTDTGVPVPAGFYLVSAESPYVKETAKLTIIR